MSPEKKRCGFTYSVETIRNGKVVDVEEVHNVVPDEGITHILGVVLKGSSQATTWYVGVFEGNYTPSGSDTMATIPSASTESTSYAGGVRKPIVFGSIAAGSVDNLGAPTDLAFSATKIIYGGFLSSSSARGGTSGTLLSAVRFSSPKSVDSSTTLRIKVGFTLASI